MSKMIWSNPGSCQALKPCISPGGPGLLINDGLRILADNNMPLRAAAAPSKLYPS